jgi:hypothetical protein
MAPTTMVLSRAPIAVADEDVQHFVAELEPVALRQRRRLAPLDVRLHRVVEERHRYERRKADQYRVEIENISRFVRDDGALRLGSLDILHPLMISPMHSASFSGVHTKMSIPTFRSFPAVDRLYSGRASYPSAPSPIIRTRASDIVRT